MNRWPVSERHLSTGDKKNKINTYISKIEFSAKRLWVGRAYNIYIYILYRGVKSHHIVRNDG